MENINNNVGFHVGKLIDDYMERNKKSPALLSRKLGIHINNVMTIKSRASLQLSLLERLSHIYRHNFIADIAAQLPPDYTGALQDALTEKDNQIAALQNELAAMAKERDIYKDLLKR